MVRCLAEDLIKKGMRVEFRVLLCSSSPGNRRPDIEAVSVLDVQIVSAFVGDWVLPTETKYRSNSSLVDNIAERFGVGGGLGQGRGHHTLVEGRVVA